MKLIEIPISRFQPETPLTRDTFLFLPLNNKTIRIALAGEVIAEPMLVRILAKGHTHLRVSEESDIDPNTFAVHVGNTANASVVESPLREGTEQDTAQPRLSATTEAESNVTIAPDSPQSEQGTLIAGSSEQAEEGSALSASAVTEPSQSFTAEPPSEESTKLNKSEVSSEDETHLGASDGEDDPENRFKGGGRRG